ncbi:MAG TPA: M18 family aminopeptidase [Mycobacteriales bacterium]|nr:M18 family aminopeptidase [Mycobacteriales bacterium]
MNDLGNDLRAFVDASPSPHHAVAEATRRLGAAGFTALDERERWALAPGEQRFVVRDGGSLVAFRVGSAPLADAGVRLVGTHTDSPTFRVRPRSDVTRAGYRLVGVEPYGGMLAHTWMDRDLTVAGRVVLRDGSTRLVRLDGSPLRMPSLAIHLDRGVNDGLVLDRQRHLVPVLGLESEPELLEQLGLSADEVLGHDLVLTDTQPAGVVGSSWVSAPRLDNLGSCHSAVHALVDAAAAPHTQLWVANDHEEVGSGSAEGARGSFLEDVLVRLVAATGDADPQAYRQAIARSRLVSADMAHAVHPNYAERHEPQHTPQLGGGPVLKHNANQSYATDATTQAWFAECAASAGVPVQHFVTRADLPCGSTIGPLTATRIGLATVDVGSPMLSMHSCRELASMDDVPLMVAAMTACLS